MRDLREYLRAYWTYVSTKPGWARALGLAVVWLAGMFVPLGAKTWVQLPDWLPMTWMIGWALLGYVFAPYGMWKQLRAQVGDAQTGGGKGEPQVDAKPDIEARRS
jgi:hypothetical protein